MLRTVYPAPCGTLYMAASDDALCRASWHPLDIGEEGTNAVLDEARKQLDEYFAGTRREFDVPLCHAGTTEFQQRVWQVLKGIPYGTTITYKAEAGHRQQRPPHGLQRRSRQETFPVGNGKSTSFALKTRKTDNNIAKKRVISA